MGRYLHHLALTTSRVRRSLRSEVDPRAIEICTQLLDAALAGGKPVVPGITPPLTMTASGGGQCVSVTLRGAGQPETEEPLFTIGIAGTSRCGAALWRKMQAHSDPVIERVAKERPRPPEPWCAARIDSSAAFRVNEELWSSFEDLERALAWAFLDRKAVDDAA